MGFYKVFVSDIWWNAHGTVIGGFHWILKRFFCECSWDLHGTIFLYIYIYIWLMVWNMFYSSIYWECHHPNWLSYVSDGFSLTINQIWYIEINAFLSGFEVYFTGIHPENTNAWYSYGIHPIIQCLVQPSCGGLQRCDLHSVRASRASRRYPRFGEWISWFLIGVGWKPVDLL